MIEQLALRHLAVEGHTEGITLRYLVAPGLASFTCDICGVSCSVGDKKLFVDWDLNEFDVCPPCLHLETYHKIQSRKRRPYYYLKKEIARSLGVPYS